MIGIYKIENKVNGKCYIGQSIDIERRWKEHVLELNKGCHHSIKLQRAWDKYGSESFKFDKIYECEREFLNINESYFINQYKSVINGYNIAYNNDGIGCSNKELEVMTDDSFNNALNIINMMPCDFYIRGELYNERFMSKHYSHRHYDRCCSLLNFAVSIGVLKEGGWGQLSVVKKRHTISSFSQDFIYVATMMSQYEYVVTARKRKEKEKTVYIFDTRKSCEVN